VGEGNNLNHVPIRRGWSRLMSQEDKNLDHVGRSGGWSRFVMPCVRNVDHVARSGRWLRFRRLGLRPAYRPLRWSIGDGE
jgi:hypothetical protein